MASNDLVADQAARLADIDALLPVVTVPPDGETLVATLPDGDRVTGVLETTFTDPATPEALWSALEVWRLTPFVGLRGADGMDAILRALLACLDRHPPSADSACVVPWPSRDAEVIRVLLDHGLVPLSALAVRTGAPAPAPGRCAVAVRKAEPRDLATVLRLEQTEVSYTSDVGSARVRPSSGERVARADRLRERLAARAPIWLAELDGEPVGFAECGHVEVIADSWLGTVLPEGRWGYVASTGVLPGVRGTGVGRSLMAVAHAELAREPVRGTYLYYNPPNPLASVFWHRQGYRPLWTVWEVRPASALR